MAEPLSRFSSMISTMKQYARAQERIRQGYKRRFRLSHLQEHYLRMFFGGEQIPTGMTENEVRLLIRLYPALGSYRASVLSEAERFLSLEPTPFSEAVDLTTLPDEFVSGGRMTRRRFNEGLKKLLPALA